MINKSAIVRDWLDGTITNEELKIYIEMAVVAPKAVVVELPQ